MPTELSRVIDEAESAVGLALQWLAQHATPIPSQDDIAVAVSSIIDPLRGAASVFPADWDEIGTAGCVRVTTDIVTGIPGDDSLLAWKMKEADWPSNVEWLHRIYALAQWRVEGRSRINSNS